MQVTESTTTLIARYLADLRWLLLSPALFSAQAAHAYGVQPVAGIQTFSTAQRALIEQWLQEQINAPQMLLAHMQGANAVTAQPLRLGRAAERLLEFFLLHGPTHRLVAANVALRTNTQGRQKVDHTTIGEIDFLLHDLETSKALHWELAVKFFLCTSHEVHVQTTDFVGPDRAELLPHKLHKLFGKQLCHVPPAPYDQTQWQAQAFTRGWMFYPWSMHAIQQHCEALNPTHARGHWITQNHMHHLPPGQYMLIERKEWMAPATLAHTASEASLPLDQMQQHIQRMFDGPAPLVVRRWPTAQLVARIEPDALSGNVAEVQRFFIVPNDFAQAHTAV